MPDHLYSAILINTVLSGDFAAKVITKVRREEAVPKAAALQSAIFNSYHLRSRNVEVVREFADTMPIIQADRQQLRQLFLNLLNKPSDDQATGGLPS